MALVKKSLSEKQTLFCRIGWAERYQGDEDLIGGGRWNYYYRGGEASNFLSCGGYLYGYFHTSKSERINIERIDPNAKGERSINANVVFVARHPVEGGQRIIGWHKGATVFRNLQEPVPERRGGWHLKVAEKQAVLLPLYCRTHPVPAANKVAGGFGQSNTRYPYDIRGAFDRPRWAREAMSFIEQYSGPNLLTDPTADAVDGLVQEVEQIHAGQGRLAASERRAVECRAITVACRHLRKNGFTDLDTSPQATRPYDICATKGRNRFTIEVKGTTGNGERVVLTRNEVTHARKGSSRHMLLIVHGICLADDGEPRATGGKLREIGPPFKPPQHCLCPIAYDFHVPDTD